MLIAKQCLLAKIYIAQHIGSSYVTLVCIHDSSLTITIDVTSFHYIWKTDYKNYTYVAICLAGIPARHIASHIIIPILTKVIHDN